MIHLHQVLIKCEIISSVKENFSLPALSLSIIVKGKKTFPPSKMINQEMRHQKQKLRNFCFFVFIFCWSFWRSKWHKKCPLMAIVSIKSWSLTTAMFFFYFAVVFFLVEILGIFFCYVGETLWQIPGIWFRVKASTILYFRPFCFLAAFISIIYYFLKIFNIKHFRIWWEEISHKNFLQSIFHKMIRQTLI